MRANWFSIHDSPPGRTVDAKWMRSVGCVGINATMERLKSGLEVKTVLHQTLAPIFYARCWMVGETRPLHS
jgi:hypothetical protein